VKLDRLALTEDQLAGTEAVLYAMADLINRLKPASVPYTKIILPSQAGGQ